METTKEKIISNSLPGIQGKWKLSYKPKGSNGAMGFGGLTLNEYTNPKTGQKLYRRDPSNKPLAYYMLDKIQVFLFPDTNPQDRLDIEWMIHHPEVIVEGYDKVPIEYKRIKKKGSQITLVALDYQEMNEIEEEDFIDKLIGYISDDSVRGLGIKKIRYILSALGKNYKDARFIDSVSKEKKALRKTLKNYTRASYENAKKVKEIIDNLEEAQIGFELKEMSRLRVITSDSNGMYKFNGLPLGIGPSGILGAWQREPELKVTMLAELDKAYKIEEKGKN